jgi:hypothetical protein
MAPRLDLLGVSRVGGRCFLPPSDNDIDPHAFANCEVDPYPTTSFKPGLSWFTEGGYSVVNEERGGETSIFPALLQENTTLQPLYNFFVPGRGLTQLATNESLLPRNLDPQNLLKSGPLRTVLVQYLSSSIGTGRTIFNGASLGCFINDISLIPDALGHASRQTLIDLDEFNNSSYSLSNLLRSGVRTAARSGKLSQIQPSIMQGMTHPWSVFPNGKPPRTNNEYQNRVAAYSFIKKNRIVLKALVEEDKTSSKGMLQRVKQRYWVPPTDINLNVPVVMQDGVRIGVKIKDRCGLEVPTVESCWDCSRTPTPRLVTCNYATVKNATFMPVRQAERRVLTEEGEVLVTPAKDCCVSLKSDIDRSFILEQPHLSVVYGLLDDEEQHTPPQYGFDIAVSSPYVDKVEQVSGTYDYKEAYLLKMRCDSLTSLPHPSPDYRKTQVNYDVVWKTGDEDSLFESTVSAYSGPRCTVYVDVNDPWLRHLVHDMRALATYTDLDLDRVLQGHYPRRINRDILIVPVDKYEYSPAYGQSNLTTFSESEGVKRTLTTFINPTASIYSRPYTKTVTKEDGIGLGCKPDNFAIRYGKGYDNFTYEKDVYYNEQPEISYSTLGKILNKVDDIKKNYDLSYEANVSALTQVDLFSFFNLNEVTDFIVKVPYNIRSEIFQGLINSVALLSVPIVDPDGEGVEPTYLSPERQVGVNMNSERNFRTVPNINGDYFPPGVL